MLLKRVGFACVALCTSIAVSVCSANPAVYAQEQGKYLIFHLDAVPYSMFTAEYESGRLPNLRRLFGAELRPGRAVSPFPAGTETIYPRLKAGAAMSDPYPLGWSYYDATTDHLFTKPEVFLKLLSYVPRRSVGFLTAGIPGLNWYAGLAFVNLPQLLRRYDTVECFWFATDFWGHWSGVEGLQKSLRLFDSLLGPVVDQLPQPLNLVLYTDHGMRSVPYRFNLSAMASAVAGANLRLAAYPLIYLYDPALKAATAQELVRNPAIEYAFYQDENGVIVGEHKSGTFTFDRSDDKIRYLYTGCDILGYKALGYNGEFLTDQEWLNLTIDAAQPALPAHIANLMQNSLVSDVVVVSSPDFLPYWTSRGAHTGVWTDDLVVLVLVKGPDLDALPLDTPFWLNTLYEKVPVSGLNSPEPREPTLLSTWVETNHVGMHSGSMVTWSPLARHKFAVGVESEVMQAAVAFDLYSDFVTRIWAGLQLTVHKGESKLQPVGELEVTVGNLTLNLRKAGANAVATSLRFQILPQLSLDMATSGRVGLSWTF